MRSLAALGLLVLAGCQTTDSLGKESRYKAVGTEPFWSIQIAGNTLIYTSPERTEGVEMVAKSNVYRSDIPHVVPWTISIRGTFEGKLLILQIYPSKCSDGMSDKVYPMTSELTIGQHKMHGCAELN